MASSSMPSMSKMSKRARIKLRESTVMTCTPHRIAQHRTRAAALTADCGRIQMLNLALTPQS
jgi:hypothetical protein